MSDDKEPSGRPDPDEQADEQEDAAPETEGDTPPPDDEQPPDDDAPPEQGDDETPPEEPTDEAEAAGDSPPEPSDEAGEALDEADTADEELPDEADTDDEELPPDQAAEPEDEAESGDEPEPGEETEAPPEEPQAPERCYDGLDSGLSWFGAEPFQPPVPTGYTSPVAEAEGAARPMAEGDVRRQLVRQRIAARRKQADAEKKWYQRIPMGAISMLPIVVVVAVLMILYPPWGGIPGPKAPFDDKLLTTPPVADQDAALRAMGIGLAVPRVWQVLPGNVLLMAKEARAARLEFTVPKDGADLETTLEVCILKSEREFGVALELEEFTALDLRSHEHELDRRIVRLRLRHGRDVVKTSYNYTPKPRHWHTLGVRIESGTVRFSLNGKTLAGTGERPPELTTAILKMYNVQLAVRNWTVKPID